MGQSKNTQKRPGPVRPSRRVQVLLVILLLVTVWLLWGNRWISTSRFTVSSSRVPSAFDGFVIAHVSDLHGRDWGSALTDRLRNGAPDLILITGDLIDSNHPDLETAVKFAGQAAELAPVFFVGGNHEAWSGRYSELKDRLTDAGVGVLEDEAVSVARDRDTLRIFGLMDPAFYSGANEGYTEAAGMASLLAELEPAGAQFSLLMSHRPEQFDLYVRSGADLVLAGHAHGGQVRLPLIGGLVAPDQGFFPRYTAGAYKAGDTTMIVSRGLGNSIIPIRINNNPELVFIELRSVK